LVKLAEDRSEDVAVRIAAVESMWFLGHKARDAVPALKKLAAQAENAELAQAAKDALTEVLGR
jgi:hypothetical protein